MLRHDFMNFSSASNSTVAEDTMAYVIVGDANRNMIYEKDFFELYSGTTRPNLSPSPPQQMMTSMESNSASGLSRLEERLIDERRHTPDITERKIWEQKELESSSLLTDSSIGEEITPISVRRSFEDFRLIDSKDGTHLTTVRRFEDLLVDETRSVDSQGNVIENTLATGSSDIIENILENDLGTNIYDATPLPASENIPEHKIVHGPCPLCGARNGKILRSDLKFFVRGGGSNSAKINFMNYPGFAAMRARVMAKNSEKEKTQEDLG